ncbi:HAD family hydrolase [Endozoicomonas arenosclerae]|uniref:HAD family hydrolase n=1 Tax=Endozoicomonas arenosclerae TaxID=1633495 RepID=UPI0007822D88|nr:HAD hydrolase-like protein [Endozoicomonas arenosclerae]
MSCPILFDMDGVIADSWKPFFKFWSEVLAELGAEQLATKEQLLALFEGNFFEELSKLVPGNWMQPNFLSNARLAHLQFMSQCPPIPEVNKGLDHLAENYPLYLVTSNFTEAAEYFLKNQNIDCFRAVLGMEHSFSKIEKIRSVMKQHPEQPCYFISDTSGDLHEAREAGAIPVAAAWGWHSRDTLEKAKPAFILDTPSELLEFSTHM